MKSLFVLGSLLLFLIGCGEANSSDVKKGKDPMGKNKLIGVSGNTETAVFAGGCFWFMEEPFENTDGVISVTAGYSAGMDENTDTGHVSKAETGRFEAVKITYDPEVISYPELLDIFWKNIDPTDAGGSFRDRGPQYQSAIFYNGDMQKKAAEESKNQLNESGVFDKPLTTKIFRLMEFRPAEESDQDYYKKNPEAYSKHKKESGREDFITSRWGSGAEKYKKPSDPMLKVQLTDKQYSVTQMCSTEGAFNNEYWNNHEEGIYVDVVTGEPLFSSRDKFDSGTGWPSFTKPIEAGTVVKRMDDSYGMERVEVKSKSGNSHLGHLFYDGPDPTGLRYCMNSAALRFIPKSKMKEEGYGEYLWKVESKK